ncbi:glycosyltransferase [Amphibacillus jilinensis]|uniref:glycosyltransferase n=1 Tax=Amphibacillus jilinensis TaxID=1216008 RepID=UPI00030685AE|nr:glycosyltransferase [Amphibacillus jilinensis]
MVKIVFFVKPGLDNFLNPIINQLAQTHTTKKVLVKEKQQIDVNMQWADICWFEWCDDLVVYGSQLALAYHKKIICRLHSYEAFTNYIKQVNLQTIDRIIFVGEPIKAYVKQRLPQLTEQQTCVIENGVDLAKYTYKTPGDRYRLASLGYINYKKGPMLLIHAFKALHEQDSNYRLHIAGAFQDQRYQLYFNQILKALDLEKSVHFDGWQTDPNHYLADKDYIISSSLFETQHMSIMEGMAKGIKPLVHNFYGAQSIYDSSMVWSSIPEFVDMVINQPYDAKAYRRFIEEHYHLTEKMEKINNVIEGLSQSISSPVIIDANQQPKVTVGIINYNYADYLDRCLRSVLAQTYSNIEIIIIDDHSTDDSIERIQQYTNKHANISVIVHDHNTGLPDIAMRDLIETASGEYLLPISADDYLFDQHVLMNYVHFFSNHHDVDYVYGNLMLVDEHEKPITTWHYQTYNDQAIVQTIFERFGSGVIPMIGLFKLAYYRDHDYEWIVDPAKPIAGDTLNCLVNIKRGGWRYHHLDQPVLCHRRHDHNLSFSAERIVSMIYLIDYIVAHFTVDIYLPNIDWTVLNQTEQQACKHFYVGKLYWNMLEQYHATHPLKQEDFLALSERIEAHFKKSLHHDSLYQKQVTSIKERLKQMKPKLDSES